VDISGTRLEFARQYANAPGPGSPRFVHADFYSFEGAERFGGSEVLRSRIQSASAMHWSTISSYLAWGQVIPELLISHAKSDCSSRCHSPTSSSARATAVSLPSATSPAVPSWEIEVVPTVMSRLFSGARIISATSWSSTASRDARRPSSIIARPRRRTDSPLRDDHGNWDRVDRGLFRLPDWPTRDEDRYVLWRLWSRGLAVVSHQSALVIYDLGDVNPTRLHLTVPLGFRAKDAAVVIHRSVLAPADVEDRDGYQITSVQRTLFDTASGDMTQEQLDVAVADAVKRGLVAPRRLRHRADEFGPRAALRIERALTALESESLCSTSTVRPELSVRRLRCG
jgi:hypothetical protein